MKSMRNSTRSLNPDLFNIEDKTENAGRFVEFLEKIVEEIIKGKFTDVIIDSTSMSSSGSLIGDRTISFQSKVYHNTEVEETSLSSDEWKILSDQIFDIIYLVPRDSTYRYSMKCTHRGKTFKIIFSREDL